MRIIFILLFSNTLLLAQAPSYSIESYVPTPRAFQELLLANQVIAQNDTMNERIIDLVEPMLVDSMIERKRQHHKIGPVGFLIHAFGGYNWRAFSMKKEKVVGTVIRQSRYGDEKFTEYDINFDLNFHLDKYLYRIFAMYDRQAKIKRQDITSKHKRDYSQPPYQRDSSNLNSKLYKLHCELTPEKGYRSALNYLFYPTLPGGGSLAEHPNFEQPGPSVGFYGTLCLDCNHSCHPEVHPYEWMWWLKALPDDNSRQKEWHLGIFHEGSNRLKKWSVNPMIGQTCIPFAFQQKDSLLIKVEHRVMHRFVETGLQDFDLPQASFDAAQRHLELPIRGSNFNRSLHLHFIQPIRSKGLRYWLSKLNYDPATKVLSGYLNIAVAVEDLCTWRVLVGE